MLGPHSLSLEGLCRQVGFTSGCLTWTLDGLLGSEALKISAETLCVVCMYAHVHRGWSATRPPSGWQNEGRLLLFNQQVKGDVQPGAGGVLPQEPASARMTAHPDPQGVYDPIKIRGRGPKPFRVCKDKMVRAGR